MTQRFRIALAGTGLITRDSHLPAALASDKVDVVALVDPVRERAAACAQAYGISPRIAASIEEVLGSIDGAVIATPNHLHMPIAVACLEAGVSTLIEKPLASSAAQGEAILAAARKSGATVAAGYSTRFRNNIILLKELLDENYFGRVTRFAHQFGTVGGWAPLSAYNLRRESSGGGVLVVTGTHFLDRMLYFWGYPAQVQLEDDSLGGPEANCSAVFRYGEAEGGLSGIARYSKTFALPGGLVIETESGAVTLADLDESEIVLRPADRPGLRHVIRRDHGGAGQIDPFFLQLEDFVDACTTGRPPRVDGEQALLSLKLIEALYADRRGYDQHWYAGSPQRIPDEEVACESR